MIYTASYFESRNHHGLLVPTSRSVPKVWKSKVEQNHPLHYLLAPPKELLDQWKEWEGHYQRSQEPFPQDHHIEVYTAQYREHVRSVLPKIKNYLQVLDSAKDETWLCWEPAGEFCHRNLAIALVEKFRPDCYGGMDVPVVEEEIATSAVEVKTEPLPEPKPLTNGRIHLKGVKREYEFLEAIAGNMTHGPMVKLKSPEGRTAFWLINQIEEADAIVSGIAEQLTNGQGEETWREYFVKLFQEDHCFLGRVSGDRREKLVEYLQKLEGEQKKGEVGSPD